MTEDEWFASASTDEMLLWLKTSRERRPSGRKIGLFAVACAEQVRSLLVEQLAMQTDPWTVRGLALAEELSEGSAGLAEFNVYHSEWSKSPRRENPSPQSWCANMAFRVAHVAVRGGTSLSPERRAIDACKYCGAVFDVWCKSRMVDVWAAQPRLLRDIVGNPFRPVAFSPGWRTTTAVQLARGMYESRDFAAMPILADALQDAGCDSDDVLSHCRDPHGVHVRGCWVVDGVLGKA